MVAKVGGLVGQKVSRQGQPMLLDEEGCYFGVASPDRWLNANDMPAIIQRMGDIQELNWTTAKLSPFPVPLKAGLKLAPFKFMINIVAVSANPPSKAR